MDKVMNRHLEWLDTSKIRLLEKLTSETAKGKKIKFSTKVLVWDPELDYEWSIKSRNGVRYNREESKKALRIAIDQNDGVPIMYNHVIDDNDADQLGLVRDFTDSDDGLIVSGLLNGNKQRVSEEIVPGFLNNVSLQVDAHREEVEEDSGNTTYAKPTDFYEISFVPVNGIVGANTVELALAEAIKKGNKKLLQESVEKKLLKESRKRRTSTIKEELTTSTTGGASATKLIGTDGDAEPIVTCSAEQQESLSKDEIEDELSLIESKFDIKSETYDKLYSEAVKESKVDYDRLYKEAYETSPTMEEIQSGLVSQQMALGLGIEMEHKPTYEWLAVEIAKNNGLPPLETFARMIAEDHLREDPEYYTKLKAMVEPEPKMEVQQIGEEIVND